MFLRRNFTQLTIVLFCLFFHSLVHGHEQTEFSTKSSKSLVFALCVNNTADVEKTTLLLKSLDQFGGKYSHSKFYIVYRDFSGVDLKIL